MLQEGQAKKVTRPPGWRTKKHTDVSRFSRKRPTSKNKVKMDSGLRRNDGDGAFAEMTPAARSAEKKKAPIGRFITKPGEEILSLRWAGHRESNSYFLSHVLL